MAELDSQDQFESSDSVRKRSPLTASLTGKEEPRINSEAEVDVY